MVMLSSTFKLKGAFKLVNKPVITDPHGIQSAEVELDIICEKPFKKLERLPYS